MGLSRTADTLMHMRFSMYIQDGLLHVMNVPSLGGVVMGRTWHLIIGAWVVCGLMLVLVEWIHVLNGITYIESVYFMIYGWLCISTCKCYWIEL